MLERSKPGKQGESILLGENGVKFIDLAFAGVRPGDLSLIDATNTRNPSTAYDSKLFTGGIRPLD